MVWHEHCSCRQLASHELNGVMLYSTWADGKKSITVRRCPSDQCCAGPLLMARIEDLPAKPHGIWSLPTRIVSDARRVGPDDGLPSSVGSRVFAWANASRKQSAA